MLEHEWVDAILTDINMPVVDGEEFLRRLAADEMLRAIPAIVISTDATANRIERLMALGARGYVTKPFRPEALRAELERTWGCPVTDPTMRAMGAAQAEKSAATQAAISAAVAEVLESMFFVEVLGEARGTAETGTVAVEIRFEGDPPGWFQMRLGAETAQAIAADFLGEDPESVSPRQSADVALELANMICGAVLSRLESSACFRLGSPRLVAAGEVLAGRGGGDASTRWRRTRAR